MVSLKFRVEHLVQVGKKSVQVPGLLGINGTWAEKDTDGSPCFPNYFTYKAFPVLCHQFFTSSHFPPLWSSLPYNRILMFLLLCVSALLWCFIMYDCLFCLSLSMLVLKGFKITAPSSRAELICCLRCILFYSRRRTLLHPSSHPHRPHPTLL